MVASLSALLLVYRQGDARYDPYGVDRFLKPMQAAFGSPPPQGATPCDRHAGLAPATCSDVLVVPDPVLTDYFLNYWQAPQPWYATNASPLDTRLLNLLTSRYGTIWLARDRNAEADDAEDRRATERYLAEHAYKVDEQRFGDWARLLRFSAAATSRATHQVQQALGEMTLVATTLGVEKSLEAHSSGPAAGQIVKAASGDVLQIGLHWRADGQPATNYTVFTQLLDGNGQVAAQRDRWPGDGLYPTAGLRAGQVITDNLALPLQVAPGRYRLIAGLYRNDVPGAPRLSGPGGDSVELATVDVQAQP
jgi:hypothetical protein